MRSLVLLKECFVTQKKLSDAVVEKVMLSLGCIQEFYLVCSMLWFQAWVQREVGLGKAIPALWLFDDISAPDFLCNLQV